MLHANTCLQVVLEINFRQCLCDIVKSTMAFKPLKKNQQNIFLWMSSLWFVYRLPVYRVIQSVTYISQKWKLIYQICSRHDIAEILLKLTLNPKSINFTINIQSQRQFDLLKYNDCRIKRYYNKYFDIKLKYLYCFFVK